MLRDCLSIAAHLSNLLLRCLSILTGITHCAIQTLEAQQPRLLTGRVVEATGGAPLSGAVVAQLGTGGFSGVISDASGNFRLRVPRTTVHLVVARMGFAPDTIPVGSAESHLVVRLHQAPYAIDPLIVKGERNFSTASSGIVHDLDIQLRPRKSSQELLRLVPGLVIAQHAGGGKAEQIFLRGFDADHGTDVAISVDGVPANMVSHAHGQGYADLHFVIPELVERVEVRKGPFDIRDGDFATAGAVELHVRERLPGSLLKVRRGSFNTTYALGATALGDGAREDGGYVAAAGLYSDGPFEVSQGHRRGNLYGSWTAPAGHGREWVARASAFGATWDASGQVPQRAVDAGRIGRFGAIDPTEGGETYRADASLALRSVPGPDAGWQAQIYLTRYYFDLFSNFTFFLNDPVAGDGIEQVDDRWILGGRASYGRTNRVLGREGRWESGVGVRSDAMDVALFHQRERLRLGRRVNVNLAQQHFSGWAEQQLGLGSRTRLSLGIRGDIFHFRVEDRLAGTGSSVPHRSGTEWQGILSPRANLAFDFTPSATLFLNGGGGFHSNDARDVLLADKETVLPRAWGGEVGLRSIWSRGSVAASLWILDLESELVYVGDEGIVEPSGRSRRLGMDLEGRARLLPWLWADADLNLSRGRFVDEPEGADYIPLAPPVTATAGITVRDRGPVGGGVRLRHIGSRPANEINSIHALGHTLWEAFGSCSLGAVDLSLTVDNIFNIEWNDAQFATTSRLYHEPHEVTELHFTPGAPRSIQLGVIYRF